jgi:hypothetical protein
MQGQQQSAVIEHLCEECFEKAKERRPRSPLKLEKLQLEYVDIGAGVPQA